MPIPEELQAHLKGPTTSVEVAAKFLGIGRNQAYQAAASGEIETIQIGRRKLVPTAWLLRRAHIDPAEGESAMHGAA